MLIKSIKLSVSDSKPKLFFNVNQMCQIVVQYKVIIRGRNALQNRNYIEDDGCVGEVMECGEGGSDRCERTTTIARHTSSLKRTLRSYLRSPRWEPKLIGLSKKINRRSTHPDALSINFTHLSPR